MNTNSSSENQNGKTTAYTALGVFGVMNAAIGFVADKWLHVELGNPTAQFLLAHTPNLAATTIIASQLNYEFIRKGQSMPFAASTSALIVGAMYELIMSVTQKKPFDVQNMECYAASAGFFLLAAATIEHTIKTPASAPRP